MGCWIFQREDEKKKRKRGLSSWTRGDAPFALKWSCSSCSPSSVKLGKGQDCLSDEETPKCKSILQKGFNHLLPPADWPVPVFSPSLDVKHVHISTYPEKKKVFFKIIWAYYDWKWSWNLWWHLQSVCGPREPRPRPIRTGFCACCLISDFVFLLHYFCTHALITCLAEF